MSRDQIPARPRAGLTIPGDDPETALDLSGLPKRTKPPVDRGAISELSKASGFTSRSVTVSGAAPQTTEMPPPRRRMKRSEATAQFNGRVTPATLRRIHDYCEEQRLTNGEFLEAAISALEKTDVAR